MRFGLGVFNTSAQGSVGQLTVTGIDSAAVSDRSTNFTVKVC